VQSKSFTNGHQIVGILVFILLIAQWVLGFLHHRSYLKTQRPTWMIKPHKFGIGPVTMALGLINAAFGFKFALAGNFNLVYVPIVIAVLILLTISILTKRFLMGRRRIRKNGPMGFGEPGSAPIYNSNQPFEHRPYDASASHAGAPAPAYGGAGGYAGYDSSRSDIALSNMGQPPSYSQQPSYSGQPAKPREMI
jgi:hypothetical protein